MTKKTKQKDEEFSEAEVLNEIETRIRKGKKPVLDWEKELLLEGYRVYNAPIPKDIQKKLKIK